MLMGNWVWTKTDTEIISMLYWVSEWGRAFEMLQGLLSALMDRHQTQRSSHIFQEHQSTTSYSKCLVSNTLSGSLNWDETRVRQMSSLFHHSCQGLVRVLHPLIFSICQSCPNVKESCWLSGTVFFSLSF